MHSIIRTPVVRVWVLRANVCLQSAKRSPKIRDDIGAWRPRRFRLVHSLAFSRDRNYTRHCRDRDREDWNLLNRRNCELTSWQRRVQPPTVTSYSNPNPTCMCIDQNAVKYLHLFDQVKSAKDIFWFFFDINKIFLFKICSKNSLKL